MTEDDHGPGVHWLSERAGIPPDALLRDGTQLARALEAAARDGIDLARRLMSADPAERRRAEAEARALRARFSAAEPSPHERLAARLAEVARVMRERRGA